MFKKIEKKFLLLIFFVFAAGIYASAGAAGDISVTSVNVRDNEATVVINEVIEIREIKIMDKDIEFPVYTSPAGQVYPQVKFRTPSVREKIVEAILNNTPSSEKIKRITYDITDVSHYGGKSSSLAGFATIVFNNEMEIYVRLMKARYDNDYWIAWPVRAPDEERGEVRWQDLVLISNRRVKNIVEKDLKESFAKYQSEKSIKEVPVEIKEGWVEEPLTVTDIEVNGVSGEGDLAAFADIDLNYAFRIKEVEIYKRRGQVFLEFPRQITEKGREYPMMQVFSRALRSEMRRAATKGTSTSKKSDVIGFEITKFEKNRFESDLKFRVGVTINGALEINFSIFDGDKYDAFVSWPSVKEEGEYVDKIFPINREIREKIEGAILKRYRKEK